MIILSNETAGLANISTSSLIKTLFLGLGVILGIYMELRFAKIAVWKKYMEEIKFVIKCFIFSCLVVVFSQTKMSHETIEKKTYNYLQNSATAEFMRESAHGGVLLIQQGYDYAKNYFQPAVVRAKGKQTLTRGESSEPDLGVEDNVEDRY